MKNKLYLECTSGISGDMTVAALLDLGADQKKLERALKSLPVKGFDIKISRVVKSGIDACDFDVLLDQEHENYDHDMEYLHGHSHSHAYIYTQFGFDRLVLGRSHTKLRSELRNGKNMELFWKPYEKENAEIFTHLIHDYYCPPSSIRPFVDDKKKRSYLIEEAVRMYGVSINTVKNYLISYLVYQNILVLAPKEKAAEKKELTQDEKNMRWALNKYYYTQKKQSISTAYTQMVKEKYCDREGRLQGHYPSIHQFRYFYRKNRKMQTYYISRNGLKDYQRNYRPLVGDGVQ